MSDSTVKNPRKWVRIIHRPSATLLAEGPLAWGNMPFEGNFYLGRRFLRSDGFTLSFIPGLCTYKFSCAWLHLLLDNGELVRKIAWLDWLPNPLFPFIWFRVALPGRRPDRNVQYSSSH